MSLILWINLKAISKRSDTLVLRRHDALTDWFGLRYSHAGWILNRIPLMHTRGLLQLVVFCAIISVASFRLLEASCVAFIRSFVLVSERMELCQMKMYENEIEDGIGGPRGCGRCSHPACSALSLGCRFMTGLFFSETFLCGITFWFIRLCVCGCASVCEKTWQFIMTW